MLEKSLGGGKQKEGGLRSQSQMQGSSTDTQAATLKKLKKAKFRRMHNEPSVSQCSSSLPQKPTLYSTIYFNKNYKPNPSIRPQNRTVQLEPVGGEGGTSTAVGSTYLLRKDESTQAGVATGEPQGSHGQLKSVMNNLTSVKFFKRVDRWKQKKASAQDGFVPQQILGAERLEGPPWQQQAAGFDISPG